MWLHELDVAGQSGAGSDSAGSSAQEQATGVTGDPGLVDSHLAAC